MSLTDLELSQLCLAQYNGDKIFDHIIFNGGDCASLKLYSDCIAIVHEGSHDILSWLNNFNASLKNIPDLGGVDEGFYINLPEMLKIFNSIVPGKDKIIYSTGHSRGAARAHIFGAMLIKQGYKVEVVAFGSPRPGDVELAKILQTAPNRSYRNYNSWDSQDWVCDVPESPYVHPTPQIKINVVPLEQESLDLFKMHHIQNYIEGMENL